MSEQPTMPDNTALRAMPENTGLTTKQKAFFIFLDSSIILATGAYCYWLNKTHFNFALDIFDHIVDIIEAPTKNTE